jgi:hypothetical protein
MIMIMTTTIMMMMIVIVMMVFLMLLLCTAPHPAPPFPLHSSRSMSGSLTEHLHQSFHSLNNVPVKFAAQSLPVGLSSTITYVYHP